jgi:hypothetical protein
MRAAGQPEDAVRHLLSLDTVANCGDAFVASAGGVTPVLGFAVSAVTVRSSEGKPSCFCTMRDGNCTPPKSLYPLYSVSRRMSPMSD